ncbi:uncharacterized protein F5147DRAFT_778106 [Suillus discolor]|uniref:Uncharacterized protein n=1 Tax=Suillus discolor TaxID=1912936 RepID=A0A9P7EZA4_9AGAM|nr:uncharacterized protein F5147DRAFT_778106 [Suillus discolor]KAG2096964.1 hypothetical protein F5147DRAFT_778106 [Suillus discolor]
MPPRKKNTAKKSCGGSAKKLLAPVGSPPVPAASHAESSTSSLEPEDTRTTEDHSIWCLICRDGAEGDVVLFECNACPRVMCSKCIEVPKAHIDDVRHTDVIFLCLSCHSLRTIKEPTPYFGFYHNILPEQGGTPVLPGFLQLKGKYELASSSILAATPLAVVHFILGGKDRIPTPVPLLSHYLDKFYPSGGFLYIEILFDVASYQQIDNYTRDQVRTVSELTSHLGSTGRIFAFLSNHSEEDSGWLFAGKEGQGEGEYVAMEVQHVLSTVLKPYARILKSSHIVFLVCGSVVAHETPYTQLKEAILQFDFVGTIIFPAPRFQPLVAMNFLVAMMELSWAERVAVTVADKSRDEDAPDRVSVCRYIYTCKYTNCGSMQKLPPYKLSVTKPPGSIVNSAKTKNCAWFQSPSTHFVLQSSAVSTQGKRMNEGVPTGTAKKFVNGKNSCHNLLRQIRNEIVAIHHTREDPEDLPKGLKKAIRRYYLQFLTDADDRRDEQQILGDDSELEEELGMSPEDRELAARPKDAGFYKKELKLGTSHRNSLSRRWTTTIRSSNRRKAMTSAHRKEVEEARDKWNRDGAPAESQAMYRKKNLKKVLDDFTEQIHRTMGCRLVMLVSHKKNADQTLSVKILSIRRNRLARVLEEAKNGRLKVLKNMPSGQRLNSVSFVFFLDRFRLLNDHVSDPTNDDDDSSDEETNDGKDAMPEVILDNHGYAKLPSQVFTGSMKPVPWLSIAGEPLLYLDPDSIPNGFTVQDPSHLRVKEINKLWGHWEARKASKQRLVIFVGAASAHMNKSLLENAVYVGEKKSKKKYVEVDDEEGASAAPTPMKRTRRLAEDSSEDSSDDNLAPSAGLVARPSVAQEGIRTPATVPMKDRMSFLRSLSSNREYLLFISSIGGLKKEQSSEATEWPAWATWSWEGSHLPNSVHSEVSELDMFFEVVSSAKISGLASAMKVGLGLGMLLRECKRVIEYEADDATPNTPSYLGTSILGIKTLDLVIEAINTARGGVTRMVKAKEGQHAAITEAGGEEHGTDTAAQTISTREEEVDDEKQREEDEMRRKVEEELRETEEQKKKMAMLQEDMRKLEERKRKLEEENQKLLKLVEVANEKDSEGKEPEKAEEEEEEEVVQKGKKRGKSGGSGRPSKKPTTDNIRRSSRARQPSKKAMRK